MKIHQFTRALFASVLLASAANITLPSGLVSEAAAQQVDPVHIYAQLPRTSSVRVSPDGKYVAMLEPFQGSKAVFIYNLKDPSANRVAIPTPENSIVKGIDWASNKHVVMLARIRGKLDRGRTKRYSNLFSRWVSTNVETQKSVILFQDKIDELGYQSQFGGSIIHDLPNDQEHIMMAFSEYAGKPLTRHYKVDLDSGKEYLQKNLPIDSGRIVRSLDGERILAREDYDDRSGTYQIYMGEYPDDRKVFESKFNTDRNRTTFLFTVLDGKPLVQETEQSELSLFLLDPDTGTLSPFEFDADVPPGYDFGPIFDNHTRELIGVGYTDDYYNEVYSAEPYKSWHKKARSALKTDRVTILSRTKDNSAVTLYTEGPSDPGTFYLFEPNAGRISPIGGSYPELQAGQIGKTVRNDYEARDGLDIPAYLTFPPGKSKSDGPFPLVALPHGGPIGPRDNASFDFWAQHIASQGYLVFKPQFRGSGGFGYDFQEKGYGEFGVGMLHDTIDGINHLIEDGLVDPDKICVTGASYGGYQALALPMVEPDMFKCAIAVNGVSDIPAILKYEIARGGYDGSPIKFWERVIGDYYDDRDMMEDQSPAENVEKIKAEVLIVHGSDDATVPYEQAEIMAKSLKKQGKSDDILILENDDHNLSLPQSRLKLLEASEELFAKHLK